MPGCGSEFIFICCWTTDQKEWGIHLLTVSHTDSWSVMPLLENIYNPIISSITEREGLLAEILVRRRWKWLTWNISFVVHGYLWSFGREHIFNYLLFFPLSDKWLLIGGEFGLCSMPINEGEFPNVYKQMKLLQIPVECGIGDPSPQICQPGLKK
jgi:hypothetical protein